MSATRTDKGSTSRGSWDGLRRRVAGNRSSPTAGYSLQFLVGFGIRKGMTSVILPRSRYDASCTKEKWMIDMDITSTAGRGASTRGSYGEGSVD